jgi:serine/threonine protein kinase
MTDSSSTEPDMMISSANEKGQIKQPPVSISPVGSVKSENSLFCADANPQSSGERLPPELINPNAWSDISSLSGKTEDVPHLFEIGEVTNFQILQNIGEGTFATVHLCEYPDKTVCDYAAIKCSKKSEVGKEVDAAHEHCSYSGCTPGLVTYELIVYLKLWNSAIQCPNIPSIFDYGELEEDHTYIAMELLGASWEKIVDDRLGLFLVPYLDQLVDCLQKVHENGIVHCDVKPKNILAKDMMDCMSTPYLIDFGLAFHMRTGQNGCCHDFIGTPDYSSDDRLLSRRNPLPIDDIISLGYSALHAWLGDLPWRCQEDFSCLRQFIYERKTKMKQGLREWPAFFREWFEYCDNVLEAKEVLSYEKLKLIVRKNEHGIGDPCWMVKEGGQCDQEPTKKRQKTNHQIM